MKKILIISNSEEGKIFIQRVIRTYSKENIYYIVETKANQYEDINKERFKFFEFDATSLYKLSNLLKMEFIQVFVIMNTKIDTEYTIKNIRAVKSKLHIIVLDKWKLDAIDSYTTLLDANEILASQLIDHLPNVPVIAQNVGMGEGEIMEVLVPFGSSFVYKHLSVIEQKNWRIVAIYRNRKLVLPSRRRMIYPNDVLLLVGEPVVLKSVYRAIKQELGQFPEPFGTHLYVYIDMNILNYDEIVSFIQKALIVYQHFQCKLIIKIIHPGDIDALRYLKDLANENILVLIQYNQKEVLQEVKNDIEFYHIGLLMIDQKHFSFSKEREMLHQLSIPILKISQKPFQDIKEIALILSDNKDLEKISNTIFDVSEQFGCNIELYNYKNEYQKDREEIIENFYNLSTIFSKSIRVHQVEENPIRLLNQKENFVQILPFTKKITGKKIYSSLSTDSEKLYYKLDRYHQLFIPV